MEEILYYEGGRHKLPRDDVDTLFLFLEVFGVRLDRDLSNLVEWKVFLHMGGGLEPKDL